LASAAPSESAAKIAVTVAIRRIVVEFDMTPPLLDASQTERETLRLNL
jgi:hypothetical protein